MVLYIGSSFGRSLIVLSFSSPLDFVAAPTAAAANIVEPTILEIFDIFDAPVEKCYIKSSENLK